MRKGSSSSNLTAARMSCPETVEEALKQNDGYRFLQTVRGSYPYWMKTLFDLNAMVRQLDIPTWFCSFSAADLKWPETIRIIAVSGLNIYFDCKYWVLKLGLPPSDRWIRDSTPLTRLRVDFLRLVPLCQKSGR